MNNAMGGFGGALKNESVALYWLGHSSAILELDGVRILIDPVLENASPFPGIAGTLYRFTHKKGRITGCRYRTA